MRAVAIVDCGLEPYACEEVRELLGREATPRRCAVEFDASPEEAAELAYRAQTLRRVLLLIGEATIGEDLTPLRDRIDKRVAERLLSGCESFAVRCERIGLHPFGSLEAEELVGGWIKDVAGALRVDLAKPQALILLHVAEDQAIVGLDITGVDLAKREYRVFLGPNSLKGTLAAGLLRLAGYSREKVLLDPFCGAGIIVIEAALRGCRASAHRFTKGFAAERLPCCDARDVKARLDRVDAQARIEQLPITGFDNALAHISASKKNAKIAGVLRALRLSKVDAEWIDLKFGEASVDCIVSNPPEASHRVPPSRIDPIYNELFHQAAYALKPDGALAFLASKPDHLITHATARGFALAEHHAVWSGGRKLHFLLFRR